MGKEQVSEISQKHLMRAVDFAGRSYITREEVRAGQGALSQTAMEGAYDQGQLDPDVVGVLRGVYDDVDQKKSPMAPSSLDNFSGVLFGGLLQTA